MSDDLNDYDVSADDIFNPKRTEPTASAQNVTAIKSKDQDLGLEEIQVTKKRAPVAKLDEDRLLSQNGIPKLRRITKERLKFKGKGHEYSDVARLLNLYQLWLDDLYPRAKFADGLAIIEKLGHSKRMQVMRKEWINEGKVRTRLGDRNEESHSPPRPASTGVQGSTAPPTDGKANETREASRKDANGEESLFVSDNGAEDQDVQPPEDELDALLAEDAGRNIFDDEMVKQTAPPEKPPAETGDEFADEMEAMEGLDYEW